MPRHILIIDRDPNARLAMSITLRHAGYRVSSAFDETEALTLLAPPDGERPGFDLIVKDAEAPGPITRRLTEALKRDARTIPSLVLSNFSDKAFFIDLVSHGHREFIENICSKDTDAMRIWDVGGKYTGKRTCQ